MTETKKCTKCGEVKPLDAFHRDKARKDGHGYWCKACIAAYYARPDVKAHRAAKRAIREAKPEVKARIAAYYAKPEVRARRAAYEAIYRTRPERKAYQAAYKAAYYASPEGKACVVAYNARPDVKARAVAYRSKPEVKARRAAHRARPEAKARRAAYNAAYYAAHKGKDRKAAKLAEAQQAADVIERPVDARLLIELECRQREAAQE